MVWPARPGAGGVSGWVCILILAPGDGPFQHPEQPLGIAMEPARAELKCLAAGQRGQACGQFVGTGHSGPFHQDGDNADITCQGRLDLDPDEVVGVVEASLSVPAGGREPPVADQRQQYLAGFDRGGDRLNDVVAQFNRVDVLEDLVSAEVAGEPLIQPGGG
jgi:hypothetical protein